MGAPGDFDVVDSICRRLSVHSRYHRNEAPSLLHVPNVVSEVNRPKP